MIEQPYYLLVYICDTKGRVLGRVQYQSDTPDDEARRLINNEYCRATRRKLQTVGG